MALGVGAARELRLRGSSAIQPPAPIELTAIGVGIVVLGVAVVEVVIAAAIGVAS
jgi:hypothetical protein